MQTLSSRKHISTDFRDRKGALLVNCLECGSTINSEKYCATLNKVHSAIQNKLRRKLSAKVLLFRLHLANQTLELLRDFG